MPFDFSFGTTLLSLDTPLIHNPSPGGLIPVPPAEADPALNGHRLITGPDALRISWDKQMPIDEFYDVISRLGGADAVSVDGYVRRPRILSGLPYVEWEDCECVLHTPVGIPWGPLWEYRTNVELLITDIYYLRDSVLGG